MEKTAEVLCAERLQRIEDAYDMKQPDRVPISMNLGYMLEGIAYWGVLNALAIHFSDFIFKGVPQAVLNFKNYGDAAVKVKLAIALFDAEGNLVGCGTTASKFGYTRAGKEEKVVIGFNNVKSRLMDAKYFLLTIETE